MTGKPGSESPKGRGARTSQDLDAAATNGSGAAGTNNATAFGGGGSSGGNGLTNGIVATASAGMNGACRALGA